MKRFLSIIFALALVITMIPATYATEGEVAVVYSPEYVFNYTVLGLENGVNIDAIPADAFAAFDRTKSSGVWSSAYRRGNAAYSLLEKGVQVITNKNNGSDIANANFGTGTNGLAVRITVEADGEYVPKVNYAEYYTAGLCRVFIVSAKAVSDNGWTSASGPSQSNIANMLTLAETHEDIIELRKGDEKGFDGFNTTAKPKDIFSVTAEKEFDKITLEKGDYYLLFSVDRLNSKRYAEDEQNGAVSLTTMAGYSYLLRSVELERQPYVTLTASETEVEAGSEVSVVGKAFNADDTDAGAVTYSVEPASVASVSDDGTVTALSEGTATITAKATIGGVEYADSVDIAVKPIDKTHKFVFNSAMLSDDTIAAATAAGIYRTASGLLSTLRVYNTGVESGTEYIDEYADFDTSKGTDNWAYSGLGGATIYLYPDYVQLYTYKSRYGTNAVSGGSSAAPSINTRFVFQVEVKHPGKYDITAETYNLPAGSEADVYIVEKNKVDGSELLTTWANHERMTVDFLKTLPVDGRISCIGEDKTISEDFICTKELNAGDYYIIFHANTDNPEVSNVSNGTQFLRLKNITMTESTGEVTAPETPVKVDDNVSFATDINGEISVRKDVARGDTVGISAPEKIGDKVFKCWVRGTAENGVWVSSKASDEYTVMTHTYLTAVYETPAQTGEKVVEFYKENGEYYATVAAVDGKAVLPATPTLTGYTFDNWYISEDEKLEAGDALSADVTYAVAKFTPNTVIGSVSNDVVKVNGTASDKKNFGDIVTANDAKATYWLRNGEIVKFGTSYAYYIWDAANIMSSYDTTIKECPTVVIDTTTIDGAYMIEYDKGDKAISEVGILFGSNSQITVDSCNSKATSQWNRDHGQFMAKPYGSESEKFARGYLIYGSAGDYKVIYTDAIEIQ